MDVSVEKPGTPEELLHFGVKGMRWGVRRAESSSAGSRSERRAAKKKVKLDKRIAAPANRHTTGSLLNQKTTQFVKTRQGKTGSVARGIDTTLFAVNSKTQKTVYAVADAAGARLQKQLPAIKARHGEYGKMRNRAAHPFSPEAKAYRADVKKTYLKALEDTANSMTNRAGTWQYTVKDHGKPNTSKYFWNLNIQEVKHAADGAVEFTVQPIFDDEGWIVDVKRVDDSMAQTMDLGINALIHMGLEI